MQMHTHVRTQALGPITCKALWLAGNAAAGLVKHSLCAAEEAVQSADKCFATITGAIIGTVKTVSCNSIQSLQRTATRVKGLVPDHEVRASVESVSLQLCLRVNDAL